MASWRATAGLSQTPSPVAITTRTPTACSAWMAARLVSLIGSRHRDHADRATVERNEHRRRAFETQAFRDFGQGADVRTDFRHQRPRADRDGATQDVAPHAESGHRIEVLRSRQLATNDAVPR